MLEVRAVSKVYPRAAGGRTEALRDVTLRLGPGEAVVCAGPEGAGKSTLLRLVWGAERPTRGTVRLDGEDVGEAGPRRLAGLRRALGVVPEDGPLLPDRTAFGNVVFALQATGHARPEARERAVEALREVGLGGRLTALPGELTGGGRRRLLLARALASDPRLLVLDAPAGEALDAEELVAVLRRRVAEGLALLVASRTPGLAAALPARLLRLEGGRVAEAPAAG
jgi:cell division transport system ATP-binding protein